VELDMPIAQIVKVRGGKVVEVDVHGDRAEALETVGLSSERLKPRSAAQD